MRFRVGDTVLGEADLDGQMWAVIAVHPKTGEYTLRNLRGDLTVRAAEDELRVSP